MNFRNPFNRVLRILRRFVFQLQTGWLSLINRFGRLPITQINGPAVSLTTFGQRLQTVHLTIESIGAGDVLPSRIILWLDDDTMRADLPAAIKRLKKRGLEIKFCKNYGPHKKYYPYLESQDSFKVPLVTADDDILYPRDWLRHLVKAFRESPDVLNCYRAREIVLNKDGFAKYEEWKLCTSTEPGYRLLAGSGAGVIYPPEFMMALKRAGTAFESCCPRADDIWLHVQALRAGYKVRQIRPLEFPLALIPGTQETALYLENALHHDGNDRQLKATYNSTDIEMMLT
jgi:hypothetical protein